jgi:hypothetical protein
MTTTEIVLACLCAFAGGMLVGVALICALVSDARRRSDW